MSALNVMKTNEVVEMSYGTSGLGSGACWRRSDCFLAESQPLPSPAPRQLSYQDENRNETKDPDHLFPPNNKSVNSQNGNDSKRSSTSSGHASRENTYENTQAGIQVRAAQVC